MSALGIGNQNAWAQWSHGKFYRSLFLKFHKLKFNFLSFEAIQRLNDCNKREHYIGNLITSEQITVDIAGHVIGIYVFVYIVA